MLEQGMAASQLHLLNQTKSHESEEDVPGWEKHKAIANKLYDEGLAKDELEGWDGLVDCSISITFHFARLFAAGPLLLVKTGTDFTTQLR